MARLGAIDLPSRDDPSASGAAFTLATAPQTDALLRFEKAEIEVRNGQRDAVVRFRGTTSALDTYENGRSLVQQGLDRSSMLGRIDAVIVDAEDEHTLWSPGPTGLVVRLVPWCSFPAEVSGHWKLWRRWGSPGCQAPPSQRTANALVATIAI